MGGNLRAFVGLHPPLPATSCTARMPLIKSSRRHLRALRGEGEGGRGGIFKGKRFRRNRFVFLVLFQTSASPAATAVTAVNVAAAGTEVAVAAVVLRRTRRGVQDALFQRAA